MTAIVPSQTRAPLNLAIQQHAQPPASTLVSDQSMVVDADYTAIDVDMDLFLVDTTDGDIDLDLLPGARYHAGKVYKVQKTAAANTIYVSADGTEAIEGETTVTLSDLNSMLAISWDPHAETWRRAFPSMPTGTGTAPSSTTIGDGTGSPSLIMDKVATGTDQIDLQNAGTLRGRLELDASENVALSMFDTDGTTLLGRITLNNATGAITLSKGTTITTGGLTITAGGLTISAGAPRRVSTPDGPVPVL